MPSRIKEYFVRIKLSDKILLIFFAFSTVLVLVVRFLIDMSLAQILLISNIVYVAAFLITYTISRNFSKRILKLAFKVQEMAAGNLSRELEVKTRDELGQLTLSLNELIDRVKTGVAIDVSRNIEIDQAKTDFVTLASHQLRTPLSIIKWYVDFVLGGDAGELTAEQKKYIEEVYRSNERLIELVNALLDVSRIDLGTFSIEPEPADMIKIADKVIAKFAPEIEAKKLKFEKHFESLPIIRLDPRLTGIVFQNLVSNAVKYTPEGGTIRMDIKKTGDKIFMKIADTGCGIPKDQQPRVFTKLFRAANAKKIESIGTGLGLYIVKAVIEHSGGKIWFESPSLDLLLEREARTGKSIETANKGTTFYVTIPITGMKPKKGTKKLTSVG